jgi:hypothetical protein
MSVLMESLLGSEDHTKVRKYEFERFCRLAVPSQHKSYYNTSKKTMFTTLAAEDPRFGFNSSTIAALSEPIRRESV